MTECLKNDKGWDDETLENCYTDETDDISSNLAGCRQIVLPIVLPVISIVFHFLDMGGDIYLLYDYYKSGEYSYFSWTFAFIFIPTIIMTLMSIKMYVDDYKENLNKRFAVVRIVLCVIGIIVQIPPVIRYIDSLRYAIKTLKAKSKGDNKEKRINYKKMVLENSDVALLKLFECYLESAPQLVLQITLLVTDFVNGSQTHTAAQSFFITCGFIGMGICMATYHNAVKLESNIFYSSKKKISILGFAVQFFCHLNITVSRVLALSAIALLYPIITGIAALIHWCVSTIWLALMGCNKFCGKNTVLELLFRSAFAIIYIFNFVTLKEGPTKYLYVFFYLVCGIENVIVAVVWGLNGHLLVQNWLYYFFLILPIANFVVGVLLTVTYYMYLHPNRRKSDEKNQEKQFIPTLKWCW